MSHYTLDQFFADTRATIRSKGIPSGLAGDPVPYKNATRMRRWRRLDAGSTPGYAEVELQKDFVNEPGHATVFAVGDIHSIEFGDDTFFIRVTGGDVETRKTLKFDAERKTVEVADRALGQR